MTGHKEENIRKWERAIDDWKKSGLNKTEYCKQSGLSLSTLGGWQYKLNKYYKQNDINESEDFIEVKFQDAAAVSTTTNCGIKLSVGDRINIYLETGFSRNELQKAISAVLEIS
jgi:hypothetical protein